MFDLLKTLRTALIQITDITVKTSEVSKLVHGTLAGVIEDQVGPGCWLSLFVTISTQPLQWKT